MAVLFLAARALFYKNGSVCDPFVAITTFGFASSNVFCSALLLKSFKGSLHHMRH